MANISSLFNNTFANELFEDFDPSDNQVTQVALASIGYVAPMLAISAAYAYRHRVSLYVKDLYQKCFTNYEEIQVGDENSLINKILDESFQKTIASLSREGAYSFKGREDYPFPARCIYSTKTSRAMPQISARDILRRKIEEKESSKPLMVLDLGTGNGRFLLSSYEEHQSNIEAHGVSALDTRKAKRNRHSKVLDQDEQNFLEDKYFTGNIERLFDTTPVKRNSYDLIFSSFCFMHLTDPIKTLINAYDALKEGGELYIDHFAIYGLDVEKFRSILQQKGITFDLIGERQEIDYLHIMKTTRSLDLPIVYQKPENTSDRKFMRYKFSL